MLGIMYSKKSCIFDDCCKKIIMQQIGYNLFRKTCKNENESGLMSGDGKKKCKC